MGWWATPSAAQRPARWPAASRAEEHMACASKVRSAFRRVLPAVLPVPFAQRVAVESALVTLPGLDAVGGGAALVDWMKAGAAISAAKARL
jgi:hypothetical protein